LSGSAYLLQRAARELEAPAVKLRQYAEKKRLPPMLEGYQLGLEVAVDVIQRMADQERQRARRRNA